MPVAELFTRLVENPSGHAFTIVSVPGHENVFLGADAASRPCLFVRATERTVDPPLRTSRVSLQTGQVYTVAPVGGSGRSERLHSLRCETSDAVDVDTFLALVDAFLARYASGQVDLVALTEFFRSLVRLFSIGSSSDLQGERQGLWGELFLMRRGRGFAFWAPLWHSETTRKFDFSAGNKRVEVKTAVGDERIHYFAHRQIFELEGETIMIASLLLRKEDAGLSLRDLIREARAALLGSSYYFKLEQAVRQAGMEAAEETGPAYDASEAEQSLSWYRAADSPHFRMAEPPGVSQTHYKVDLSNAPRMDQAELSAWLDAWVVPPPRPSGITRQSD